MSESNKAASPHHAAPSDAPEPGVSEPGIITGESAQPVYENEPASEPGGSQGDPDMPFLSHLVELRDRLLRAVTAVLVIFLALIYFANDIYHFISEPLIARLPQGSNMIATDVVSPFFTPFKLTIVTSIALAIPFILHQAWAFISPGLYRHEKRLGIPLLVSSVFLFYSGMAFAFYVVFPLFFDFMTSIGPTGVSMMPDIASYLDIVLKLFFAFGFAFEIPVATLLMVWSGVTTPERLRQKRPYVIVGVFVIGMLLTPPDVISQTLLAVPMWLLFELGIIFAAMTTKSVTADQTASHTDQ